MRIEIRCPQCGKRLGDSINLEIQSSTTLKEKGFETQCPRCKKKVVLNI